MTAPRILLTVLALAIAACQPPAQETAELSTDDVAATQGALDVVVEGELAGDWDAVASVFSDDAVFMMPNVSALEGREAWLKFAKAADIVITDLNIDVADVDGRGDLAYAQGTYSETITVGGAAEPTVNEGKWVWILRKQADGEWKVIVAISNSSLPLEET